MELKTRLEPRLEQRLKLTQELRAGIELLTLAGLEIELELERASTENPFLELEEEEPTPQERYRFGTDYAVDENDLSDSDPVSRYTGEKSIWEHLKWQIAISPTTTEEKSLQLKLLTFLTEEGYIREDDETLAVALGIPVEAVKRGRAHLMSLDPEGVGARGPVEAMLIQLKHRGKEGSYATKILEQFQQELERGDLSAIQEQLGLTPKKLEEALLELRSLRPIPFADWERETVPTRFYSHPDLILIPLSEGGFEVQLYEEGKKRQPYFRKPSLNWEILSPAEKEFVRQKIRAARLLLSSLTYRELTLLRIATYIIAKQGHILSRGESEAVPLTMREIAEALGYQESTVSRILKNKTILTPWGLKELKSFLRHGGVEHFTPFKIQQRIREIIENENQFSPLSDEEIRIRLMREGIQVARRTIAKYRAILGIPGQKERRKPRQSSESSSP